MGPLRNTTNVLAFFALLLLIGCGPTLDPGLSPPVVEKPIHSCAQTIAFFGANRDAKIAVYVNGTEVVQVPSWMGWGAITLPSTLTTGTVVTAAQIVGNRISERSRDPVTVSATTASVGPDGKLPALAVLPPLYECQEAVRADGVVKGATVTLRKNGSSSSVWNMMTPYSIARFGVPALKVGDDYEAMESLCRDPLFKSDWAGKQTVLSRPASLATPPIAKPLVGGGDAAILTDLVTGALVTIFADSGSGPVAVGGGVALDTATVFKINPPIDPTRKYTAVQALCDLKSPPGVSVTPVKDPPAPSVRSTCEGGRYVTVCDTTVLSTVTVTMNGTKIAEGAGNGGCVTLGLGNAHVLQPGKTVSAVQVVGGNTSPPSTSVTVASSGAPAYNPTPWNTPAHQPVNNCYNYGADIMTDTRAQPGRAHGVFPPITCPGTGSGAVADGLIDAPGKRCPNCSHLVALVVSPGDSRCDVDYHWYRQDATGRWSHKPGGRPATDRDYSGNLITSPETADRKFVRGPDYCLDYSNFCGYYCVDKSVVVIK